MKCRKGFDDCPKFVDRMVLRCFEAHGHGTDTGDLLDSIEQSGAGCGEPENPLEMGEFLSEIQWDFNVGASDLRNIRIFGHFLMKCCHVLNFCDISKLGAVLRQVGLWSSLYLKRRCWGGDSSNGVGQLRANNNGNLRVTPPNAILPGNKAWFRHF